MNRRVRTDAWGIAFGVRPGRPGGSAGVRGFVRQHAPVDPTWPGGLGGLRPHRLLLARAAGRAHDARHPGGALRATRRPSSRAASASGTAAPTPASSSTRPTATSSRRARSSCWSSCRGCRPGSVSGCGARSCCSWPTRERAAVRGSSASKVVPPRWPAWSTRSARDCSARSGSSAPRPCRVRCCRGSSSRSCCARAAPSGRSAPRCSAGRRSSAWAASTRSRSSDRSRCRCSSRCGSPGGAWCRPASCSGGAARSPWPAPGGCCRCSPWAGSARPSTSTSRARATRPV